MFTTKQKVSAEKSGSGNPPATSLKSAAVPVDFCDFSGQAVSSGPIFSFQQSLIEES